MKIKTLLYYLSQLTAEEREKEAVVLNPRYNRAFKVEAFVDLKGSETLHPLDFRHAIVISPDAQA